MIYSLIIISQSPLEVEQHDKRLSMNVANPNFSIHFPTGLIYEDVDGTGFTNLSDNLLRIADKPFGYQIQTENVTYTEMTKNSLSINHYDTPHDKVLHLGPQRRGFWGPRKLASPYYHDFNTFGHIYNIDMAARRLTELRDQSGTGALRFYRYSDGYVYYHTLTINDQGNPVWMAVSDRHAKENITDSSGILNRLIKLQLKDYNYKGNEISTTGYIAQEVQKVFPDLVSEMEDGRLGVNYMGFSPLSVQAIKEQQEIINDLEARLKKIEERMGQ